MDLNKVMLIGRLTRDPESRSTTTGRSVVNFSVATSRVWKNDAGEKQEQTEFNNIVAWGKLAEICTQYLKKGQQVYVEGRLQTRDWAGQDGVKRYRTEIVADNMIMLGGRSGAGSYGGGSSVQAPSQPAAPISEPVPPSAEASDEIKVEDIPF